MPTLPDLMQPHVERFGRPRQARLARHFADLYAMDRADGNAERTADEGSVGRWVGENEARLRAVVENGS